MKKNIAIVFLLFCAFTAGFAQSALQTIAQVNLTRKEPITIGQVKKIVTNFENTANRKLTVEERKQILMGLAGQRLLIQAAEKEGIKVLDSEVTEYFNNVLSSQVRRPVTEAEFSKLVKQEYNQSLEEFFKANTGGSVAEAKKMLKDEIAVQKYVMSKKSAAIQKMSVPTDGDIRSQYELNKQMFFRPDTMKLFIVGILKKGNDAAETAKITALNEKAKKSIKNLASIRKNAAKEGYITQDRYAVKNAAGAQALGLQLDALMKIFENKVNFVSDVIDMADNKQFFVITDKYDAKILNLSDVIDPAQTVTVYEYIKNMLSSQMQTAALQQANQALIQEIKTDENLKILTTDAELNKVLSW